MLSSKNSHRQCPSFFSRFSIGIMFLFTIFLAGCATLPSGDAAKANSDLLYKEADAELAKGQKEKAIALLNRAAKENPTSTAPWLKMSGIWFEIGNYPSAILAANAVLERDATNQEAKSVMVVAGLRVAAGAVAGLRPNGAVNMSARVEAENLTNSLRDILGEKVLVPSGFVDGKQVGHSVRARPRMHVQTSPSASKSETNLSGGSGDPFKLLK